ncbi:MAG: hypothetical protein J0H92_01485 [Sphingobacteriales bacterium]|jgi:hypothetical protein|nr:hypothetical protein [Sphingobacteriales bacterium]NCT76805.1 hypothetical protein [Chitinophagaceae bacterium]OJW33328.1 MAG: hypothetical protein BGO54_08655 [Sphingobacteriales bacterium 46-32]
MRKKKKEQYLVAFLFVITVGVYQLAQTATRELDVRMHPYRNSSVFIPAADSSRTSGTAANQ